MRKMNLNLLISTHDYNMYRTRAIISRGLYFFTPFFTVANIVEWLILQSGQYFVILFLPIFFQVEGSNYTLATLQTRRSGMY